MKMKKIMFVLAAVLMSSVANAAALNWSAWGWNGDSANPSYDDGYAYLYMMDSLDGFSVSVENGQLVVTGGTLVDHGEAPWMAGAGSPDVTHSSGTFYVAAILTTEGSSSALPSSGYYGYETGTVTWDASTGGSYEFGGDNGIAVTTQITSGGGGGSGGIPEPTSGLLLLVGGSLLALRRKQK